MADESTREDEPPEAIPRGGPTARKRGVEAAARPAARAPVFRYNEHDGSRRAYGTSQTEVRDIEFEVLNGSMGRPRAAGDRGQVAARTARLVLRDPPKRPSARAARLVTPSDRPYARATREPRAHARDRKLLIEAHDIRQPGFPRTPEKA